MRVFILSRGYPTKDDPAWGCFERDHALLLKNKGHEVVVFSVDKRFRVKGYWGINHRIADGINIYDCRVFPSRLLLSVAPRILVYLYSIFCLWTFNRAAKNHGLPDVIYSHYLPNTAILGRVKRKFDIPILAMEHWSMLLEKSRPKYVDVFAKYGYSIADKVIAVSEVLNKRLLELYNVDSIVINNIISPEFHYLSPQKHPEFRFISIGQLLERKGFDVLINAYSKSKLPDDVKLLIIGDDGGKKDELIELSKTLKISNKIDFLGKKTKHELANLFAASDVFVLSSRSETFGVVFIEAMMYGLPVIGTRCGGPDEIINEENGILVDVDNVDQLSDALIYMYNHVHEYNRLEISRNCSEKYSADVIYEKIYSCMYNLAIKNK